MNYFDSNTWIGRWPFTFQDTHTPQSLSAHLKRHGIGKALVSPIDAVFAPEPGPANEALLHATCSNKSLIPVPVVNPALANWKEQLAAVAGDSRVRVIRLLPAYHNYRLTSRRIDEFLAELDERNLRAAISMRLIDERHEYFALNIKAVPLADLTTLLKKHPKTSMLANGLGYAEVAKMLPGNPAVLADISFAEWDDTIARLVQKTSATQLAFGSHTPFLITAASTAKFDSAKIRATQCTAIAHGNLEKFLKP